MCILLVGSHCVVSVSQVSGIQVVYNMEAPPGSRVCSLKTLSEDGRTWMELNDERSYPMVAGMYIANGGDGHTCLSNNKWVVSHACVTLLMILIRVNYEIGEMDTDTVGSYMEVHRPVNPQIEGRIKIDNSCTRTAKPVRSCNPLMRSLEAGSTISSTTTPILSLVLRFLENIFS